jgi:hypothetical protein
LAMPMDVPGYGMAVNMGLSRNLSRRERSDLREPVRTGCQSDSSPAGVFSVHLSHRGNAGQSVLACRHCER